METTTQIHTYEDYAELPEGPPYYQLIDGELIMTPSPSTFHQQVVSNVYRALYRFVQDHGEGVVFFAPIDVYLSETEVYQPDIVFIDASRREIVERSRINGAPDLVIEVLSPSTGYYDLTHKKRVYAECGVREYWLVDPNERTVELLQPGEEGTFRQIVQLRDKGMVASHLLAGWRMTLEEVFYMDLLDDEQ